MKKYLKFINENVNTKSIYLAGGWGNWRDVLIQDFPDINFLDPREMTTKPNWFELETESIRSCDGVIGWLTPENTSGFGMTYEMGLAYGLNKPYLFLDEQLTHNHEKLNYRWPMQRLGSEKTFNTYEDLKSYIIEQKWFDKLI